MVQNVSLFDSNEEIVFHNVPIGEGVKGFVYMSKKHKYHIFVNDSLSMEIAAEVIAHEMYHIKHDFPKHPYIIGLDKQHTSFEYKARLCASAVSTGILALLIDESSSI